MKLNDADYIVNMCGRGFQNDCAENERVPIKRMKVKVNKQIVR